MRHGYMQSCKYRKDSFSFYISEARLCFYEVKKFQAIEKSHRSTGLLIFLYFWEDDSNDRHQ